MAKALAEDGPGLPVGSPLIGFHKQVLSSLTWRGLFRESVALHGKVFRDERTFAGDR